VNRRKLLAKVLRNQKNVQFADFENLVEGFGFKLTRTSGSHKIYVNNGIDEILNLQNVKGEAKPYQVKQFLKIIELHNLKLEDQ